MLLVRPHKSRVWTAQGPNGNDKAVSYTADALAISHPLEIPGSRATLVKDVGAGPGEFSEGVLLNRSSIAFVGGNAAWGSRGPGDKV
ncbi:hypothetical protein OOU_Y34scaffold00640g2 [Pyricularia oryzae Y34]|uniref:Uncharacterized protein n=2 Tax=Pyricularia oryzae TaxID=318829 RepID=A0AA97NUW1_PYRO3|nr:hypothetical protein OOU_Y34scaffold00640g2 [Pyricularia oryzae Y34]